MDTEYGEYKVWKKLNTGKQLLQTEFEIMQALTGFKMQRETRR